MDDVDVAPLGYLLYRVSSALRPQVTAVLGPLGLALPEFVCMRALSLPACPAPNWPVTPASPRRP